MTLPVLLVTTLLAATPLATPLITGDDQEKKKHYDDTPLTEAQQETLLETRVHPWITNNFNATCSLMFAVESVAIHTHSKDLSELPVYSPFPKKYKPTWRECFDTVARQVTCSWAYDSKLTYWVFTPEPKGGAKLPFELDRPSGWTSKRQGNYQAFRSENKHALVEVHMLGSYSTDEERRGKREAFYDEIRDQQAMRLIGKDAEEFDLKTIALVDVADHEARYDEKLPNEMGYQWRQWIFLSKGYCFVVNSTTSTQFDKVLSKEVQQLLDGFEVTTPAPGWPDSRSKEK